MLFLWAGAWDLAIGEMSKKTGMNEGSEESEDAKGQENSLKL